MTERIGNARVWDVPLRLWHWAFALCVGFSLFTGLDGDIGWLEWHVRSGLTVCGLLVFRLGWAIWGGRYARAAGFKTSPRAMLDYFRGRVAPAAVRTPPGVALALLLVLMVLVQATTGLFATDDIFTEGPLASSVETDTSRDMTWVHNRLYWGILAAIGIHLLAHIVYAIRGGDHPPRSMLTGIKPVAIEPTENRWMLAVVTAALAGLAVWGILAI